MPQHPFYSSKQWRDARASKLRQDKYCETCWNIGIKTFASQVDHRVAITAGGHPFARANLRSMCGTHHSQKTIMIDGQHAGSGKALVTTGLDGWPIEVEKPRGKP